MNDSAKSTEINDPLGPELPFGPQPMGDLGIADFLSSHSPRGGWALTAIVPDGRTITSTFKTVEDALGFIERHNADKNIYYSVNRLKRATNKKASKADVAHVEYLHVDADPADDETPQAFKARFLPRLRTFEPKPTFIIDSGNGVQLLWRLSAPVAMTGEGAIADIEARNYALAELFGASPSTRNIDRILRVPGTFNHPNAKKRRIGRIGGRAKLLEYNDVSYPVDAFPPWTGAMDGPAKRKPAKRIELPANLPAVDLDAEFSFLSPDFRRMIRTGPKSGEYDDDRSKAVWHVVCALVRGKVDPEKIAAVILDQSLGISEHVYDQSNPEKYAERQVERALAEVAKEEPQRVIVLDFTNGKGRALTTTEWMIEQGELIADENGEIIENPYALDEDEDEGEPLAVEYVDKPLSMSEADIARFTEPGDVPPPPEDETGGPGGDQNNPPPPEGEAPKHPPEDDETPKQSSAPTLFDPWAEYDLPEFPLDVLPAPIKRYVENTALSMGCDGSAFAMCLLAAASGAISHEFKIRPMQTGDWTERPNLWLAMIGDPSQKKSPMMQAAMDPLRVIERDRLRDYGRESAAWKAREKARGKAKGDGKDEVWDDEPKVPPRLLAGDATYEKLARLMSRSPDGMLAHFDELAGLLGGFGRYNSGGGKDRSFYLSAWSGGHYSYDRATGGEGGKGQEITIDNCSLSIIGGIQMERLRDFADIAADGLLQRFLPVIVARSELPQEIDYDSGRTDYGALIQQCVNAQPAIVLLSAEARGVFEDLRVYLHDLSKAATGLAKGFSEFIAKLSGYSMRVALVLHIIHDPERASRFLDGKTARDAVRLVKGFIIPHALECYRRFEEASHGDRLKIVASYLLTARDRSGQPKDTFTPSDFTNNVALARNMTVKGIEDLLSPFVAAGWLDELDDTAKPMRGKRAPIKWGLNPVARREFAKRQAAEHDRKELLARLMRAPRRKG